MPGFRSLWLGFSAFAFLGCISSGLFQSDSIADFPVFVSGSPRLVGGQWVVQESNFPVLNVSRTNEGPPPDTTGTGGILPSRFVIPQTSYALEVSHDTTWGIHFYTHPDPKTNINGKVKIWRGFPCQLSHAEGYQRGGGANDSILLVFSGAHIDQSGDSVRLALVIDTAKSRAADPRMDLSPGAWIYARARATCPEI